MISQKMDNIEFVLTYTENIEKAVYEAENDPNLPKTGGGNGHSRVSDPTAAKAIRNILGAEVVTVFYGCKMSRKLRNPHQWLEVAYATKAWFDGTMQEKILEHRFKDIPDKRKDVCEELCIGSTYYSMMLKEIFTVARAYAAGKGLIPIHH